MKCKKLYQTELSNQCIPRWFDECLRNLESQKV